MLIDLQLHSTYSDGSLTPTQLAGLMYKNNVKVASLTDHNTVAGQEEFKHACKKYNIKTVLGLEVYVKMGTTHLNLLWYNYNQNSPELHKILRESQIRRKAMVRKMLNKLVDKGFKIEVEKIIDKYTHYIPLNMIVDDVYNIPFNRRKIHKELKNSDPRLEEIMGEYFFNKKIGILRESYTDIKRIVALKKKVGGQLIFNHPGKHNKYAGKTPDKLKKLGIDGIEVLTPHHSLGAVMYSQYLAKHNNWIETGGSDFHRFEGDRYRLQDSWQWFKIDSQYLKGVQKIIG